MSILIVEDNVISSRMLEGMLKHHGLEPVVARNGVQALQALQDKADIQVILLDLMMPEMDGFQFLQERSANPQWKALPVIVMTALADNETVRRVLSMGCKQYVVKPVREDSLIPKLKELLPSPVVESLLRNRFEVMQGAGLDEAGYDEMFSAFHEQTRQLLRLVGTQEADFPAAGVRSFADDAQILCGDSVSKRLQVFAESSDRAQCGSYLQHLLHDLDVAQERRSRIKARISGQD